MIEFKADCGHTVRAKNEDEGKTVRCSYCGHEAQVPMQQVVDKDLDFLFREIEQQGEGSEGAARPKSKKPRRSVASSSFPSVSGGGNDVFGWAMKMVYAAVLLMILIVVGKMYVMPLLSNSKAQDSPPPPPAENQPTTDFAAGNSSTGMGLQFGLPAGVTGIYVDSVPPGARLFVSKQADAGSSVEGFASKILGIPQSDCNKKTRDILQLNEAGKYVVVCTLPINHAGLKPYPNYRQFRQAVEEGHAERFPVERFLQPDRAAASATLEFRDEFLVYRVYEVDVAPNQWSQVVALFLPPVAIKDTVAYLPFEKIYNFDVSEARSEMSYYEFNATDQSFLIQALERVGGMAYNKAEPGGSAKYYWLGVGLGNGAVRIRPL